MQCLHHVPEQAHRLHLDRLMASFQCRYLDNMTSERVDAEGVKNVAAAAKANTQTEVRPQSLPSHYPYRLIWSSKSLKGATSNVGSFAIDEAFMICTGQLDSQSSMSMGSNLMQERKLTTVLSMGSEQDISRWERLDDVIMGGQSSSSLKAVEGGAALFSGDLILEGGGFCGARTKVGILLVTTGAHAHKDHPQACSITELAQLVHTEASHANDNPVEQSESGCLLSSHADWGSEQDSSIMLMSGAVSRGWIWTSAHTMA